jgi:hypothetical protein
MQNKAPTRRIRVALLLGSVISLCLIANMMIDLCYSMKQTATISSSGSSSAALDLSLLMHQQLLPVLGGDYVATHAADTVAAAATALNLNTTTTQDEGWRDIHVFVGKPSNLSVEFKLEKWTGGSRSQVGQDKVVKQLLNYKKGGFFVDLAANNAVVLSNTYTLERDLNWHGLCIEPNILYWPGHLQRKCEIVAAVVGANRMEAVNFIVPVGQRKSRDESGGIEGEDFDNKPAVGDKMSESAPRKATRFYTVPVLEILTRFHAPQVIDYLSLDVEGAEYFIMQNFPFDQYRIRIMTIERPSQNLVDMLYRNDYIYVASFNEWGDETLFVHKDFIGSMNLTAASPTLHKTRTRLMEIPKDLMQESPKVILKPMQISRFKKYLKEKEDARTDSSKATA